MQQCLSKEELISTYEKELPEIKRLAALAFTPREIGIILELESIDDFIFQTEIEQCGGPVYRAFHGGRLQREHDLREKIFKLADSGSSPAQTMGLDILQQSLIKMIDR